MCKLLQRLLADVQFNVAMGKQLIEIIASVLSNDCEASHPTTKLNRKHQLIDMCFVQHPQFLTNLLVLYFGDDEEQNIDAEESELL